MRGENKLSKEDKKALELTARQFLDLINEAVSMYVDLEDVDGLTRLVNQVDLKEIEALRRRKQAKIAGE